MVKKEKTEIKFLKIKGNVRHLKHLENKLPSYNVLQGLALQAQQKTSPGTPKENARVPVIRW